MKLKLMHAYLFGTLVFVAVASPLHAIAAEMASANLSAAPAGTGEQYSLTLNDIGSTTVGTFWFGWIPGDNFMPVSPTNVTSPAGWTDTITSGGPSAGYAIRWEASNPAAELTAGGSLSGFTFDSTLTLAQLEGASAGHPSDPVFTAFVYSGAPFSDSGFQLTATATPEPSVAALAILGLGFLAVAIRRTSARPNRQV